MNVHTLDLIYIYKTVKTQQCEGMEVVHIQTCPQDYIGPRAGTGCLSVLVRGFNATSISSVTELSGPSLLTHQLKSDGERQRKDKLAPSNSHKSLQKQNCPPKPILMACALSIDLHTHMLIQVF